MGIITDEKFRQLHRRDYHFHWPFDYRSSRHTQPLNGRIVVDTQISVQWSVSDAQYETLHHISRRGPSHHSVSATDVSVQRVRWIRKFTTQTLNATVFVKSSFVMVSLCFVLASVLTAL